MHLKMAVILTRPECVNAWFTFKLISQEPFTAIACKIKSVRKSALCVCMYIYIYIYMCVDELVHTGNRASAVTKHQSHKKWTKVILFYLCFACSKVIKESLISLMMTDNIKLIGYHYLHQMTCVCLAIDSLMPELVCIFNELCHHYSILWLVALMQTTVRCLYIPFSFLQNPHDIQTIAGPWGQGMGCLFWVWNLIYILLLSSKCHR